MLEKTTPILLIIFLALSCFKDAVKQKASASFEPGEMTSARAVNVPINLVESMASRYNIELPNVLIKQQDGYEEFDIDRIEPPVSFDWMLFKYHYPIPEMRVVHEERLKIKYRYSRDEIDWSDWRFDEGTPMHDNFLTKTFAQRMTGQRGPTATTLPQRYVEFKIISYTGYSGDTLLTDPSYGAARYNRNSDVESPRLKKNNKITF